MDRVDIPGAGNGTRRQEIAIVSGGKLVGNLEHPRANEWGKLYAPGILRFSIGQHYVADLVRNVLTSSGDGLAELIGRSGHSRVAIDVRRLEKGFDVSDIGRQTQIDLPVAVTDLRSSTHSVLLQTLRDLREEGQGVEVARLLLRPKESALNKDEVDTAIDMNLIALPPTTLIREEEGEAILEFSLEDITYLLSQTNLESNARNILLYGKHSLNGVQGLPDAPEDRFLTEELEAKEFFVGGITISVGPYLILIDESTSDPEVFHLAARVLDGIKTTGLKSFRHVELFNKGTHPANLKNLKIRARVYVAPDKRSRDLSRLLVQRPRIHADGFKFTDLFNLDESPDTVLSLLGMVDPLPKPGANHSILLAGGRAMNVPWEKTEAFQRELLARRTLDLVAEHPSARTQRDLHPRERVLTDLLGYVGGEQSGGKVLLSYALPKADELRRLLEMGLGVFIGHDLPVRGGIFSNKSHPQEDAFRANAVLFNGTLYEGFVDAARAGANLFMAFHETQDFYDDGVRIPAHIRRFHKGFWVRLDQVEAFDAVDTVFAMYGSHKDALKDALRGQMGGFLDRMKALFGDGFAITHGKGPGVMELADKEAETRGIFRIGVGIGVERKGQGPNFRPPAMVDFDDKDRLPRQKLMDDLATFKIFNVGGGGTLEEAAVTFCSQKLGKNIITPMIFVDPEGLGENGEHLWQKLIQQMEILAASPEKRDSWGLDEESVKTGLANVRLLSEFAPKCCHLVNSYDEAACIIEAFVADPFTYYSQRIAGEEQAKERAADLNDIEDAYKTAMAGFSRTGMRPPSWFNREKLSNWLSRTRAA